MNRLHGVICSSGWWARSVEQELLPWGLSGLQLGDDVLEIGPGFGATTAVLADRPGEVIAKQELMDHVWSDVTVEEGSLRVHVAGRRGDHVEHPAVEVERIRAHSGPTSYSGM